MIQLDENEVLVRSLDDGSVAISAKGEDGRVTLTLTAKQSDSLRQGLWQHLTHFAGRGCLDGQRAEMCSLRQAHPYRPAPSARHLRGCLRRRPSPGYGHCTAAPVPAGQAEGQRPVAAANRARGAKAPLFIACVSASGVLCLWTPITKEYGS